jgi:tetratricopeptide (TPR) repeat protein
LLERALTRKEQLFGPSRELAVLLNNLGLGYRLLGKDDLAVASCQRGIAIGPNPPELAMLWDNLGGAWYQKKDFKAALDAYERALRITETALGADNREMITALGNIADVLGNLGQYERALAALERAKRIGTHASNSTNMDQIEINLGELYVRMGRLDEALAHAERGVSLRQQMYGAEHPLVAEALLSLGAAQKAYRDRSGALKSFERALAILEKRSASPEMLSAARFGLARALWDASRDRPRSRSLAKSALAQAPARARAEIESWLAKRR